MKMCSTGAQLRVLSSIIAFKVKRQGQIRPVVPLMEPNMTQLLSKPDHHFKSYRQLSYRKTYIALIASIL